jgi:hypothetical protein
MVDQKTAKGGPSPRTAKGATISKMDAVRRILAERGQNTLPTDIQRLAKQRFGLNITRDHVSVCKSEIRRQEAQGTATSLKPVKKEAAPRPQVQSVQTPAPATPAGGGQGPKTTPTKMEAMRQALSQLGKDALPLAIQGFLKTKFGLEMTRDLISKYKSDLVRAKSPKPKASPIASKPAANKEQAMKKISQPGPAAAAAPPVSNSTDGIDLEDIQTVKALVGRVGAEQFRKLIDLLGK